MSTLAKLLTSGTAERWWPPASIEKFIKSDVILQSRSNWRTLCLTSLLIGLLPGIGGLAVKLWFLNSKHGFANVAGALSISALSFGQRLSFFRGDLVFALLLLPACIFFVRVLLPTRWCWWIVGTVTFLCISFETLAFAELAVLGTLTGFRLIAIGVVWGISHPTAALSYLFAYSPSSLMKVIALAAAAAAVILLGWRIVKPSRAAIKTRMYVMAAAVWILCAPLAIASWLPWMSPTRFHAPMISLAVEWLFPAETGAGKYQGLSIEALRPIYQKLVNAPDAGPVRPYWGAAKDYDVIFVVMETGPAHILMQDPSLKEFPNLQRLSQQAWVGSQHYTTSPESVRAVSSILLSTYPPNHAQSFEKKPGKSTGLIQSLHAVNYRTGIYLPNVHGSMFAKQEEDYYETMGPDRVFTTSSEPSHNSDAGAPGWRETEDLDLAALRELETDFRASASAQRRFFGVYLPQLSHEPWVDVSARDSERDMAKRRYNLMKLEDRHLGELMDTIEKSGRLDRTLIVVACDHGLRNSDSDSSFREGQIDDLTFHVPFFLYAPGIVSKTTKLPWPTSHIDIAPSILDLLGISESREFEAGTPVWNAGLRDRCVYFFASQFFGADGYRCGQSFSMWNPMLNVTYTGPVLHFTASDAVPSHSRAYQEIVARVQGMGALRNAWYDAASGDSVAVAALGRSQPQR